MSTFYIPSSSGWSDTNIIGSYAKLRLKVVRSYSAADNTSYISITPQSYCQSYGGSFVLLANASVTLNGETVYSGGGTDQTSVPIHVLYKMDTVWRDATDDATGEPIAWTASVAHAADGSASFDFAVDMRFYSLSPLAYPTWYGRTSSKTITEPRASTVTASDGTFGSPVAITVSRQSSSYTHSIRVDCAGRSTVLYSKVTNENLTWSPTVATYAPLITSGMTAPALITCTTYSGNSKVGTSSVTITMSLPAASVKPTLTISAEDTTSAYATYGAYVATKSKLRITTTNSLKYGATLVSTKIEANGETFNTSPAVTSELTGAVATIKAKISDSRGQSSAQLSQSITILAYSQPKINAFTVRRCDSDGTANNAGDYFKASYDVEITSLNSHNSKSLTLRYKKRSASSYTSQSISMSGYTKTGDVIVAADVDSTYDVKLSLQDDFSTTSKELQLSSASTRINFGAGNAGGIGIGMVSQLNRVMQFASGWGLRVYAEYVDGSTVSINDLTDPGTYRISLSQTNDINYCGFDGMAIVEVIGFMKSGYTTRLMQRITSMTSGEMIVRISTDGSWSFSELPVLINLRTSIAANSTMIRKLRPWSTYSVSVAGRVWMVYTKAADAVPVVTDLDSGYTSTGVSCTASSNCSITLGNSSSSAYTFSLHQM